LISQTSSHHSLKIIVTASATVAIIAISSSDVIAAGNVVNDRSAVTRGTGSSASGAAINVTFGKASIIISYGVYGSIAITICIHAVRDSITVTVRFGNTASA
jgi:hypothetical protein